MTNVEFEEEMGMKMVSLLALLPAVQCMTNFLAWYNFARKHETRDRMPEMGWGLKERVWTINHKREL